MPEVMEAVKKLTLEYLRDDLQDAFDDGDWSKIARTINDIDKALGRKYWDPKKGVYVNG